MGNKYKKQIYSVLALIIVIIIFVIAKQDFNSTSDKEYQFPLQAEEIESVLAEQKINWKITDQSPVNDAHNIFTLRNDKNITMGINTQIRDNQRILSMTWFFPSKLTSDETSDFFKNELERHFELPGIFYGNKKDLDRALKEVLRYYLDEDNYDKGLEWNKRVGNDHLKAQIKPMSPNNSNQVITLLIMPNEAYEDYLRTLNYSWKKGASEQDIKIFNATVSQLLKSVKKEIPPVEDEDIFSKHFVIHGSLENIKENKKAPESLMKFSPSLLKPNKDKYLNATLVDDTGNVNVFVEMTSLNADELSQKRNHNVMMLYYNNEPIYVVRNSILYSEELRAQEIAKDFLLDLYTVNSKEVDNYESAAISLISSDSNKIVEAMQINDDVLKSLMTEDAYNTFFKNRQNLVLTQACLEGNYTMQVMDIQLSENKNNIENNEVGYNFELQQRYIFKDSTMTTGTSKGLIELDKIDGNWKVTGYRNLSDVNDAQQVAEVFLSELYTVNFEEITILDLNTKDIKLLAETNESNDKVFEPIMTKKAYNMLVKSRHSFMFTLYCAQNNYIMDVLKIELSQKPNDTVEKVNYDFNIEIKYISNNVDINVIQTDIAKGYLELIKENDEWKISDYREIESPKLIVK